MYPPCTPLPRFYRFRGLCRNEESISCALSVGLRIPTPPASTILLSDLEELFSPTVLFHTCSGAVEKKFPFACVTRERGGALELRQCLGEAA